MTDVQETPAPSPAPVTDDALTPPTFDVLPLSAETRSALDRMGYTHPTPVQRAVFEPAKSGRDLVVQARTGTGKTAAFGLPLVEHLVRRSLKAAQALVLCPTRELALQVAAELTKLGEGRGVSLVAIYGGAPMGRQIDALAAGAQVVVGTPGRVLDHLRRGTLDATQVRTLVLDEADEMLSMGFERELHAILDLLPKERQTLLFSATLPPDIERMARDRLRQPEFVTLSGDAVGALSITHYVYLVTEEKLQTLLKIIEVENPESAIVFCNTKAETEIVAYALQRQGFEADWLNGDLEQNEREAVMSKTRAGGLRFLVATDVAARGIDISLLTHVINYDFPESAEAYVHRTGRTGRAGRTGTAISLVRGQDIGNLYMLRLTYQIRPFERQLPTAGELKTRHETDVVQMVFEAFEGRAVHPDDLSLARRLLSHDRAESIVAGLLRERLGERPAAEANAASARRAKAPPPYVEGAAPAGDEERAPRRERGARPPRERGAFGGRDRSGPRERGAARTAGPEANEGEAAPRVEAAPLVAAPSANTGPAADPTANEVRDASAAAPPAPRERSGAERRPREATGDEGRGPRERGAGDDRRTPRYGREPRSGEAESTARAGSDASHDVSAKGTSTSSASAEASAGATSNSNVATGQPSIPQGHPSEGAPRTPPQAGREPRRPRSGGRWGDSGAETNPEPVRYYTSDATSDSDAANANGSERRPRGSSTLLDWHPPEEEGDDRPIFAAAGAPAKAVSAEPTRAPAPGPARAAASDPARVATPEPARVTTPEPVRVTTPEPARAAPVEADEGDEAGEEASDEAERDPHDYAEIFVDVGRRDGARASDFQKILRDRGGISRRETGRVRVRDKHSFVSVRRELLERALEALAGAIIAGRTARAEVARERPLEVQS